MNLFEKLKKKKDDPCWKGYAQVGMKDKDGKQVPNCLPVSEVSDETLKSYTKKAMTDTLTNKKDRNPGMKNAFKRLAGLKKPIMEAPDEDHGTMVFAHTDHNKNVTHLIVKKNDISTHSKTGSNPSLVKYVGHLPSTAGDKALVDSFKNVTHFAYKKSGGDPKKVLSAIKTHTLLGNQWSIEDHKKANLKESVEEQLDELSSVTLRQYRKAVDNTSETPTRSSFQRVKSALGYSRATQKIKNNSIKSSLMKEEVEGLEEISQTTKDSYKAKATDQIDQASKHINTEYGSLAQRVIDRRKRGLKLAEAKEYLHSVEVEDGPHQSTNYRVMAKDEDSAGEKAKKLHLKANPSARGVMASGIRKVEEAMDVSPTDEKDPATYVRNKGVTPDGEHSGRKVRKGAKGRIKFNKE